MEKTSTRDPQKGPCHDSSREALWAKRAYVQRSRDWTGFASLENIKAVSEVEAVSSVGKIVVVGYQGREGNRNECGDREGWKGRSYEQPQTIWGFPQSDWRALSREVIWTCVSFKRVHFPTQLRTDYGEGHRREQKRRKRLGKANWLARVVVEGTVDEAVGAHLSRATC